MRPLLFTAVHKYQAEFLWRSVLVRALVIQRSVSTSFLSGELLLVPHVSQTSNVYSIPGIT